MSENAKLVLNYLKVNGEVNIEILSRDTGVTVSAIRAMITKGIFKISKANELTSLEKEIRALRQQGMTASTISKNLNLSSDYVKNTISRLMQLGYVERLKSFSRKERQSKEDKDIPTYIEITRGEHNKKRGYILPESNGDGHKIFANIWDGVDFVKVEIDPQYVECIGGKYA